MNTLPRWSIAILILTVHAACPGGFDEDGPNACWRKDLSWLPAAAASTPVGSSTRGFRSPILKNRNSL